MGIKIHCAVCGIPLSCCACQDGPTINGREPANPTPKLPEGVEDIVRRAQDCERKGFTLVPEPSEMRVLFSALTSLIARCRELEDRLASWMDTTDELKSLTAQLATKDSELAFYTRGSILIDPSGDGSPCSPIVEDYVALLVRGLFAKDAEIERLKAENLGLLKRIEYLRDEQNSCALNHFAPDGVCPAEERGGRIAALEAALATCREDARDIPTIAYLSGGEDCRKALKAAQKCNENILKALRLSLEHRDKMCPGAAGMCPEHEPEPGCVLNRSVADCWVAAAAARKEGE